MMKLRDSAVVVDEIMEVVFCLAILLSPLGLSLFGQTLNVTVPPNTPFTISFKHDNLHMAMYRWWCNGAIVKNFSNAETMPVPLVPDAAGIYTFTVTVPGLPEGNHSCFVSAFNSIGESKAAPIPIVVATPKAPSTPFDIRVIIKGGGE